MVSVSPLATAVSGETTGRVGRSRLTVIVVLSVEVEAVFGLPARSRTAPAASESVTVPSAETGDPAVVGRQEAGLGLASLCRPVREFPDR